VVLQATDYYAFGLEHTPLAISNTNRYLYNGKELQDETFAGGVRLGWYDYGARLYDSQIGRFTTQDDYAEKYLDFSPYQYAADNPVLFIDMNGDSVQVSGNWLQRTAFLMKANFNSKVKFKYNDDKKLEVKKIKDGELGTYENSMLEAVSSTKQTIGLNLVKQNENLPIDSYATGDVDFGDLSKCSNEGFQQNLIHIVTERMSTNNYESVKGKVISEEFEGYHSLGLRKEEAYLREKYPNSSISYQGEDYDRGNWSGGRRVITFTQNYGGVKSVQEYSMKWSRQLKKPVFTFKLKKFYNQVVN